MVAQPQRQFARKLRQDMSLPERLIWSRIKTRQEGLPAFKRQYPFGPYVFDFYCAKVKLVIEIDGMAHSIGDRPERDQIRDDFLRERGFDIMRINAHDILADVDEAADGIYRYVTARLSGTL
ncbi:endonuclease domain-containing protein [Asticcacaulis machinosus]|uniref:DUF559 domain-containing protein n=1 Tax=Asticcacaulis machinosus TaxID=2984211 RepID=A0ABT5HJX6_9CAUL|nr:DUF559 domain-containing protein [Asticcacaulis machinosus]MDC7676536.1 DUF559 domain-containing protein [Asticcacaulis machinosus]